MSKILSWMTTVHSGFQIVERAELTIFFYYKEVLNFNVQWESLLLQGPTSFQSEIFCFTFH